MKISFLALLAVSASLVSTAALPQRGSRLNNLLGGGRQGQGQGQGQSTPAQGAPVSSPPAKLGQTPGSRGPSQPAAPAAPGAPAGGPGGAKPKGPGPGRVEEQGLVDGPSPDIDLLIEELAKGN